MQGEAQTKISRYDRKELLLVQNKIQTDRFGAPTDPIYEGLLLAS